MCLAEMMELFGIWNQRQRQLLRKLRTYRTVKKRENSNDLHWKLDNIKGLRMVYVSKAVRSKLIMVWIKTGKKGLKIANYEWKKTGKNRKWCGTVGLQGRLTLSFGKWREVGLGLAGTGDPVLYISKRSRTRKDERERERGRKEGEEKGKDYKHQQ